MSKVKQFQIKTRINKQCLPAWGLLCTIFMRAITGSQTHLELYTQSSFTLVYLDVCGEPVSVSGGYLL